MIGINREWDLPRYLPQVARWYDPALVSYDPGPPPGPEGKPPASSDPPARPRYCYHRSPVMCSRRSCYLHPHSGCRRGHSAATSFLVNLTSPSIEQS